MEENKDVDALYEDLRKELANAAAEEEPAVPSDQKPTEEPTPENTNAEESEELSEDDISKLGPKAQKRIREQAAEIKRLAEEATKVPDAPAPEDTPAPQDFKNVNEFLNAVEDEPSRKLLEKFYGVIKGEMSSTLAPIEQKNNETRFETEFSQYATIEGLADYKNDLRKSFLRNPSMSIKSLVGEIVTDLHLHKIKPIEGTRSTPNRGPVDTSNLSKDELYALLESQR
jgi:hypothetical protein